jgi:hypothetical protein
VEQILDANAGQKPCVVEASASGGKPVVYQMETPILPLVSRHDAAGKRPASALEIGAG